MRIVLKATISHMWLRDVACRIMDCMEVLTGAGGQDHTADILRLLADKNSRRDWRNRNHDKKRSTGNAG